MVNSQLIKETSNAFKIDERVEKIPNPVPVVEVGLKHSKINLVKTGIAANSTAETIYTTPTNHDFYLKAIIITHIRDGANAGVTYGFKITVNDEVIDVKFPIRTALAITTPIVIPLNFDVPILLSRNSNIIATNDANTATVKTSLTIFGFIDEVN